VLHFRGRAEHIFVPVQIGAETDIHILQIGEESLIEIADLFEYLPPVDRRSGASAEDPPLPFVSVAWLTVSGLVRPTQDGQLITGRVDDAGLRVTKHLGSRREDLGIGLHACDQGLDESVSREGIIIKKNDIAGIGGAYTLVDRRGESHILAVLDEGNIRIMRLDQGHTGISRVIVNHDDVRFMIDLMIDAGDTIYYILLSIIVRYHDRYIHRLHPFARYSIEIIVTNLSLIRYHSTYINNHQWMKTILYFFIPPSSDKM